jgi:hypothetical protein
MASSAAPVPPRALKGDGFDRDMQQFLISTEVSAKQILKVSERAHSP